MLTVNTRHMYNKMTPNKDSTNHVHLFITMADVSNDHQHVIVGTTGPAIESGRSHVHQIQVRTSFDPKGDSSHWHIARDTTGPATSLPNNQHTHYFSGETSYDLEHKHCFSSVTDISPDNEYCETENEYDTDCDSDCDYKYHKHRK